MPSIQPNFNALSLGVLISALALSVGCSSQPQQTDTDGDETADVEITVGVSFRTQRQGRWPLELQAIENRAEELGVEVVAQEANEDPQIQASQVENMLTQGIDVLILGAVDSGAAEALVAAAHNANVPVVAYDTPIDDPSLDYFVTRDNVAVGELQAEAALDFNDQGNWAIIKGDPSAGVAREIETGYENVLGQPIAEGQITPVYNQYTAQWSSSTAQSTVENITTKYGDSVRVYLTSSDGLAFGTVQALSGTPLAGEVFISGLDAEPANLQLIANGQQTMSVWADLQTWAETALEASVALAEGDEPEADGMTQVTGGEVPSSFVPIKAITQENVCEFVTEEAPDGWADKDEVFAENPSMCP